MTRAAVAALGVSQCVNWGVLYYAFAVLVRPVQEELGVTTWMVTGAFSLALLTSAALAPAVGRLCDRGHGVAVMQVGGASAVAMLSLWSAVPGLLALYVIWAGLGLCMAATLYEPAFAIVARAHADTRTRLRALAMVTLFGGLASTIFLPVTVLLVSALGWRTAVLVLALIMGATTAATRFLVFRAESVGGERLRARVHVESAVPPSRTAFGYVAAVFGVVTLTGAAFVANLVPALEERGLAASTAGMLGGLIGVMQLPGRVLLMHGTLAGAPARLLALSVGLQALGLGGVSLGPGLFVVAAGTIVFALGAGLSTLVRPHLVETLFPAGSGGYLNGRIARVQQLARAAGPLAIAWLAGGLGYAAVFTMMAVACGMMALVAAFGLERRARMAAEPIDMGAGVRYERS